MTKIYTLLLMVLLFIGCSISNKSDNKKLVVFCGASLTDVISEITSEYQKTNQVQVQLNLASSGTLARQIEHGANPAIFISANKKWVDYLNDLDLTIKESEVKVAGNSLVLISPVESNIAPFAFSPETDFSELFEGRLSLGDPQHVPAGSYAAQLFEKLNMREEMEPRFITAKNVRSALMIVELGEVEAGIVYKTDALKSKKVKIITEFPDSLHEPINYYMVQIKGQKNKEAKVLFNYINSENSIAIWEKYGFIH